MKTCMFYAFMSILNMKAQQHAGFHANFPFSAYFYLSYIVKGLLQLTPSPTTLM